VLLHSVEKTKQTCIISFGKMCFYDCKFWFMDVQKGTWCFCIGNKFLRKLLDAKTHYKWLIWNIWNIRAHFGNKFVKSFKAIWLDQKYFYLCWRWKYKSEYDENCLEFNNKLEIFGRDEKFSKDLFWTCLLQGFLTCSCWRNNLQGLEICFH